MWTWLESSGCLTNGMVFIFCLWRGGGNDSIIVLSAQHSLPISIQKSSAAGYPRLCNLTHTLTHKQEQKKERKPKLLQQWLKRVRGRKWLFFPPVFSIWSYLLLHLEKCSIWGWDDVDTLEEAAVCHCRHACRLGQNSLERWGSIELAGNLWFPLWHTLTYNRHWPME